MNWRNILFGHPLKEREAASQQLGVWQGLSILAPDALSSVAYGTQEILIVLSSAGVGALWFSLPISLVIVLLLAFLVFNYRQIIAAYPSGGGAYVIGRDTLGPSFGLVAGSALLIDYTLTVSVSITAGVSAIMSAFPAVASWNVLLSVVMVILLTLINLRGVKESARLFTPPTYLFIALILFMVAAGFLGAPARPSPLNTHMIPPGLTWIGPLLLLRAFSSGSSALTGIEAISNGVPVFSRPSPRLARIAMILLGLFLGSMFLGTSLVAYRYNIVPSTQVTVLQQLADRIFGRGVFFYLLSFTTMAILSIAANTSFAGFPQLASIMARDQWMPRMFLARGDRLVYQNGILVLGFLATLLIIVFRGNTNNLIPLYAVGVYLSFTIAMASLVKRRWRESGVRHRWSTIVSAGLGSVLTATVVVISIVTKFTEGAWIVVLAIPGIIMGLRAVKRHYMSVANALRLSDLGRKPESREMVVVVPIASINQMTLNTLSYALSMNPHEIIALHVALSAEQEQRFTTRWNQWKPDPRIKMVVVESQYRSILRPILRYLDHLTNLFAPGRVLVVIPELVVGKAWQNILHNHMAVALEASLVFRRDILVTVVPFHLPPDAT